MFQSFVKKPIIRPLKNCCDTSKRVCLCNVLRYIEDSNEEEEEEEDSNSSESGEKSPVSSEEELTKPKAGKVPDSDAARFRRRAPLFYVDRGRYEKHVIAALLRHGWRQLIYCERCERYRNRGWIKADAIKLLKLVWIRNRSGFPHQNLAGKMQYWNHIPNEFELTKKNFLAKNIHQYMRNNAGKIPAEKLNIHPETFFLSEADQLTLFLASLAKSEKSNKKARASGSLKDLELFIVKPIDSSGGKGISVVDSWESFRTNFLTDAPYSNHSSTELREILASGALKITRLLIAQRYIGNPLLLDGHKFDIRAYMFVATLDPEPIVFYHDGYLRINIEKYDTTDLNNKWSHISNIGLQKAHPDYEAKKLESKWSLKTWTKFMLEHGMITDPEFYYKNLKPQISSIAEVAYRSVETEFNKAKGLGSFALFGIDILIDENWKAWLLEYTKSPAGHSTLEPDDTLFADMMIEALDIVVEIDERKRKGEPLTHLKSVKDFVRIA